MSGQKELYKLIDEIPTDGEWWKISTRDTLRTVGVLLLKKGFTVEEAHGIIEDCYYAVSEEYG